MSDLVHIETGSRPWRPSSETQLLRVFHQFTIPLIGEIEQDGNRFVFWCVTGHMAPENAWAYASNCDAKLVDRLADAEGEEFDEVLTEVVDGTTIAFAVAADDKGVIQFVHLVPPADFDSTYGRGMEAMREKFQEVLQEYERLSEVFPALQAGVLLGVAPSAHAQASSAST